MIRNTFARPYTWLSAYLDLYAFLPTTPDTPFERVLYFNEENSNAYTLLSSPRDYTRYYSIGPRSCIQQLNVYTSPNLIDAGLDIDNLQIIYTHKDESETLEEFVPVVNVLAGTGYRSLSWTNNQTTWNPIDEDVFTTANDVTFNGTLWVAAGEGVDHTLAYSENGRTWFGLGKTIFSTRGNHVSWNGRMWLAAGSGSSHTLAYSMDGKNWTGLGKTVFDTEALSVTWGIYENTGRWVATGIRDAIRDNTLAYSNNGTTWTGLGSTIFTLFASQTYSNGTYWVACGKGTNTLATSNDGLVWVGRGQILFSDAGRGVSWSATLQQWSAVGEGSLHTLAFSTDPQGIVWQGLGKTIFTIAGYGVQWSGVEWIAVGSGVNTVATSTNGKDWTGLSTSIFRVNGKGIGTSNVLVDRVSQNNATVLSINNMRTVLTNLALASNSWNGYSVQTSPGGTRGTPGYLAFDGDPSTSWYSGYRFESGSAFNPITGKAYSGSYPTWIMLGFPEPTRINGLTIYPDSSSDIQARCRSPRDWRLDGSNSSGGPWVTLIQVVDIRNWEAGYPQEFRFENETPYRFYYLQIDRVGNYDDVRTYSEGIPQDSAHVGNLDFFYEQPGAVVNTSAFVPQNNLNVALPLNGYYAYTANGALIPATVDLDGKDQIMLLPRVPEQTNNRSSFVALYINGRTGKSGLRQSCVVHIQGKIFP
jgi:hypothetical protein